MSTAEDYAAVAGGFDSIAALLDGAGSVALSGHTNPDGDALGSVLAMAHAIAGRWPDARVHALLADDEPVPSAYAFLPGAENLVPASSFTGEVDVFIALDTPTRERLKNSAAILDGASSTVVIDHHPARERASDVACVVESAASTGDIVFEFMRHLGIPMSVETATCLLVAVVTDTGRFQYQNTDPHALDVASAAVAAGASCADVASRVYQSDPLAALRLRARALDRLAVDEPTGVAYSYVTLDDIVRADARIEDSEGLVDEIRRLGGVDACLFVREAGEGLVRGNLRSKVDWLDVSAVARGLGGGGHRAASGFTFAGTVDEAIRAALDRISLQRSAVRGIVGDDRR